MGSLASEQVLISQFSENLSTFTPDTFLEASRLGHTADDGRLKTIFTRTLTSPASCQKQTLLVRELDGGGNRSFIDSMQLACDVYSVAPASHVWDSLSVGTKSWGLPPLVQGKPDVHPADSNFIEKLIRSTISSLHPDYKNKETLSQMLAKLAIKGNSLKGLVESLEILKEDIESQPFTNTCVFMNSVISSLIEQAASLGHCPIVRELLARYLETSQELLNNGATPASLQNAICVAVAKGDMDILGIFDKEGISLSEVNQNFFGVCSLIELAEICGQTHMVEHLASWVLK